MMRLMSLSIVLLPKAVLLPIVKTYSNLKFHFLVKKRFKAKKGKQKYNLFMARNNKDVKNLITAQKEIAQTERKIERSLRNIVMTNRKQIKSLITNEEKSLEILATGQ
jgi:hypothetical protein